MDGMPGWVETVELEEGGPSISRVLAEVERRLIVQAWRRSACNQAKCARMLGIKRTTLRKRLVKIGLLVA